MNSLLAIALIGLSFIGLILALKVNERQRLRSNLAAYRLSFREV